MDVKFVQPFFRAGKLWCWLANTGHWPDTGGMVPGGFSANATEVEQEGLRLPPVKLYKQGVLDDEILSIILSNIRIADQRIGDIKAQAAALATGQARLAALLDRYGDATVDAAIVELKRRAARQMREKIATIADGVYDGEAFVDSDGVVDEPLRIAMRITKTGGSDVERAALSFDMSGSSPPCQGPMNSVIATTRSSIYLAVKHIFPEAAINAGTFEPLHIVDPEGTFLYAHYPRPVSGCAAEVSQRIAEAVFAALGKAIPEQLFGAPAGTSGNLGVGGFDPEKNRAYVMYVISGGGYGGSPDGDGLSNGCSTIGISKTTPIEIMEQLYPVLFEEYSLHEGSGGAGAHRGGFGVNYRIRLRRGEARVSMVMDHGRAGPPGAQGGGAGGTNKVQVIRDGVVYVPPHLSKDQDIAIRAGDVIAVSTPGGGGFGPADERPLAARERDIALGYYSPAESARAFGAAKT
jgi:N-methylhydantoinase B